MKRFLFLLIGLSVWLTNTACQEVAIIHRTRQEVVVHDFSQQRVFELDLSKGRFITSISLTVNGIISDDATLLFNSQDENGNWVNVNEIPLPKGNYSKKSFQFDHYTKNRLQLIISAPNNTTGNLTINWGI